MRHRPADPACVWTPKVQLGLLILLSAKHIEEEQKSAVGSRKITAGTHCQFAT